MNQPVRPVLYTGLTDMCVQKHILAIMSSFILVFGFFFVLEDLCMYCTSLFSGKATIISFRSPSTQFYKRRKKSRRDVDAGEGESRNPSPQRTSKRTVLRDFPRGHMHIYTEIEDVQEDPMETSDDESANDETYKMSLVPPSENSSENDVGIIESELRK
jgi:hypothetical protein